MILFMSGATAAWRQYPDPRLGWLLTPRNGNAISAVIAASVPWAADNDCFQCLDRPRYIRMLKRIATADASQLKFVVAPDVVADAEATMLRWRLWLPVLRYYGLPPAFVAQDGQEIERVPWDDLAALFIGGSTLYKEVRAAPSSLPVSSWSASQLQFLIVARCLNILALSTNMISGTIAQAGICGSWKMCSRCLNLSRPRARWACGSGHHE